MTSIHAKNRSDFEMNESIRTVIENARIWAGPGSEIESGTIAFEGSRFIDPAITRNDPTAHRKDGCNLLYMPGFVNAHGHLYSALARGMPAPPRQAGSFAQILEYIWWRLDKALDPESVLMSAYTGIMDSIRSGVTTIIDHHASPHAIDGSLSVIASALTDIGMRGDLCYEVSDRDGTAAARAGIYENERYLDSLRKHPDPLLAGHFGLHALFTISDVTLDESVQVAEKLGVGFHVHVAEGPEDGEHSRTRHNMDLVSRMSKHGVLRPDTLLIHGVHLNPEDLAAISHHPVTLVHNPQSNQNNAVGFCDITSVHEAGINLALGNDGIGGAILPELRAAVFAGHHAARSPGKPSWALPFSMLMNTNTSLASKAFGLPIGRIEPGYAADFISVDYTPPTPWTKDNTIGHFLFGLCERLRVLDVWVNGNQVLRDGRFIRIDEDRIAERSRAAAAMLWDKLSADH